MDYHEIKLLLDLPAVRLIRAHNAPLILGFMHRVFKAAQRVSLPEGQLRAAREAYLDECRDGDPLAYHVPSPEAAYEASDNLSEGERRAYERLRKGRILLEQEKIPHAYAVDHLRHALF